MSKPEKKNGSQALDGALFLAQPASDGCASNGSVTNGNEDELRSLPEDFGGMYWACYEAGHVSGWDQGSGRDMRPGSGTAAGRATTAATAAAAVENRVRNSKVGNGETGNGAAGCARRGSSACPARIAARGFSATRRAVRAARLRGQKRRRGRERVEHGNCQAFKR
jgi:hypothetical protein